MTYQYHCAACGTQTDARRPVDERDAPLACACGAALARQFCPDAVMISTRIEPTRTRYQDLHGFESTPQHSAEYNFRAKDEQNQAQFAEAFAARKPRKTLKQRLLENLPARELDRPFTKADQQEVGRLLAQGPPKASTE